VVVSAWTLRRENSRFSTKGKLSFLYYLCSNFLLIIFNFG
jgi:hypothetical protein